MSNCVGEESQGKESLSSLTHLLASCHDPLNKSSTKNRKRHGTNSRFLHPSSSSTSSTSIPILHHVHRTASEIQLCEDNEAADFRDLCMYKRIVTGMSQKTKSIRMNSNHWNHPSTHHHHYHNNTNDDVIRNIARTRYNNKNTTNTNTNTNKNTATTYGPSKCYVPSFDTQPQDEQATSASTMFATTDLPLSMDAEIEENLGSYIYTTSATIGRDRRQTSNNSGTTLLDNRANHDEIFLMDL